MAINKTEKQELLEKLNLLLKKQSYFQQEINELQFQITTLQVKDESEEIVPKKLGEIELETFESKEIENKEIEKIIQDRAYKKTSSETKEKKKSEISAELEKFIGENLINKIGIAVLIIGVGIGVKYAIDNDLISPLVRILLGYLVGFGLAAFAIRLKKKYLNFSAVLFSGSMAIHYFITYAAYSYYNLFPQILAIILMVIITIFTVALALYYKQQVIAHFGLVGAYVVPYLLKEPFSNVLILFVYMAIINSGILFISTKKEWKPLNYVAFIATWTIFISWLFSNNYDNQLGICLIFLSLFFVLFHLVFLSYKLLLKESFKIDDILFLVINAGLLFFIGYNAIRSNENGTEYLGLFTFINAAVHALTSFLILKTELKNKSLFYWTSSMAIAFFTLSIFVQFNDFITAILWAVEVAFIFLYARSKKINVYETLSYVILFFLFLITATNWTSVTYNFRDAEIAKMVIPFFNLEFLSSLVVISSFTFIYYINRISKKEVNDSYSSTYVFYLLFPVFFLIVIYFSFFTELNLYWNNIQLENIYQKSENGTWIKGFGDLSENIFIIKNCWLLNYSLLFIAVLSYTNFKWIKNTSFNGLLLVAGYFAIIIFLVNGLSFLGELRTNYLNPVSDQTFSIGNNHLILRYIAYLFFAILLYSIHRFVIPGFSTKVFSIAFEIALSISIVWICSSELINWLSLSGSTGVYKHWLSILWGVFSFILIAYGIWKKKKHIRISAIAFLGITLIKLFFYDLTNLETVPKTIVFVSIGILLLIVSFLYNKYKPTAIAEE